MSLWQYDMKIKFVDISSTSSSFPKLYGFAYYFVLYYLHNNILFIDVIWINNVNAHRVYLGKWCQRQPMVDKY